MITYNDFFKDSGFFNLAYTVDEVRAKELFGELDVSDIETLDDYFDFSIGEQYILSKCEAKTPSKIVSMIIMKYHEAWLKIKNNLSIEYNVSEPNMTNETISSNDIYASTTSNNKNSNTKVYGFDSEDGVDKSDDTETGSTINNSENDKTVTRTVGGTGGREMSLLIKRDIDFVRENIYIDFVLEDVKSFICMDIY